MVVLTVLDAPQTLQAAERRAVDFRVNEAPRSRALYCRQLLQAAGSKQGPERAGMGGRPSLHRGQ